jgi:hypothetical protein
MKFPVNEFIHRNRGTGAGSARPLPDSAIRSVSPADSTAKTAPENGLGHQTGAPVVNLSLWRAVLRMDLL